MEHANGLKQRIWRLLILSLALSVTAFWLPGSTVLAQDADPVQLELRVGFDNYLQPSTWTPIHITASNTGEDISGELRLVTSSLGAGTTTYVRPIELPQGSRKQVTLYAVGFGTYGGEVTIELVSRGRVIATGQQRVDSVNEQTLLLGILSDNPGALAALGRLMPSSGETRLAVLGVEDLPDVPAGWGALDMLVIMDVDTGQMSAAQVAALRDWIAGGGRVLVAGGLTFQRTLAGIGDLSPVIAVDTRTVSMEPLANGGQFPFDAQTELDAPVAIGELAPDATVTVMSEGVPLVAWRSIGYGRVTFFAPDPALEPLQSWTYAFAFWQNLLSAGEPRPSWAYGFNTQWDYARQAVTAVPGVSLPSVIQLCGFLGLYVVLVGPVNYLVLRRMKKAEWAWFTIPALILIFSGIAYVTGFQLRGGRAILHRMAVIQSWPDSDTAEVNGLIGVWSPRRSRYDINFDPGVVASSIPLDFGGALAANPELTISEEDSFTLEGVRVDVGAVRPLYFEGFVSEPLNVTGSITFEPAVKGLQLTGEIINYSNTDLADVSLVTGYTAIPLGDLPAGEVLSVDVPITTGNASPQPGTGLDPYPLDPYGYYAGYGYGDDLVTRISGSDDCYSTPEARRRCNVFSSVSIGRANGVGVYLFGWAEEIPVGTQVLNNPAETIDTALHIVRLDVEPVVTGQGEIEVPPALMTWQSENGYAPYDFYLYPPDTSNTFMFEPVSFVPPVAVEIATIHFTGYLGSDPVPDLLIYNYSRGRWELLPDVRWGDTVLTQPAPYISPSGGMMLRVEVEDDSYGVSIERLDITLQGTIARED